MSFSGNKTDAVQYVNDMLTSSKPDSLSIMIMHQWPSEDCFVSNVISMSSEDIVKMLGQACLEQLTSTS